VELGRERINSLIEDPTVGVDIFERDERTWVAHEEVPISLTVVYDPSCQECDSAAVLTWLNRWLPTLDNVTTVSYDMPDGEALARNTRAVVLPAYVFDESVEQTEFYQQNTELFSQTESGHLFHAQLLGLSVGQPLEGPNMSATWQMQLGSSDAPVTLVYYCDVQEELCRSFYETLKTLTSESQERLRGVQKPYPLESSLQRVESNRALICAARQDRFERFADIAYERQTVWSQSEDEDILEIFSNYAQLAGLDLEEFSICMTDDATTTAIDESVEEARLFGVMEVPTFFINNDIYRGARTKETLESILENYYSKE
jgi:protein-disulfide isomerase